MTESYRIIASVNAQLTVETDALTYDMTTPRGAAAALVDHCQAWDPTKVAVSVRVDGGPSKDATRQVSVFAVEYAMLECGLTADEIPMAILNDVEAEALARELSEVEEDPVDLRSSSSVGMFG
jgi:hypothetical protein